MIGKPQLYLLDEVTSALDKGNSHMVESLLLEEKAAVIHVCHKVDPELAGKYDKRYVLAEGRLRLLA